MVKWIFPANFGEVRPVKVRRVRRRGRKIAPGAFHPAAMSPSKVPADMARPADYPKSRGDCGVVAVAIFTKLTYAATRAVFYPLVHRRCKRWHGGTSQMERREVLDLLGITYNRSIPSRPMALKTWMATEMPKKRTRYMVTTTGHVQIVRGDKVTDQMGTFLIGDYGHSGRMVKEVLELK